MNFNINKTSTGPRASDFRMHTLDLNPDLIEASDAELLTQVLTEQHAKAQAHWLAHDEDYSMLMADLVKSVRRVQLTNHQTDIRSDAILFADLLKEMKVFDLPKPAGQWGNARFMAKFLVGYARLRFVTAAHEGAALRESNQCRVAQ